MDNILVTNIQRFSLHDGPGIRTTVFLKGCSLRCPWCCNPENIVPQKQRYKKDGVDGVYGTWYNTDTLYREIIKDRAFYGGQNQEFCITSDMQLGDLPGGVTFSGGEALLQIKKLENLLQLLKKEHIHMAIETCLFAQQIQLRTALEYIDLFYVDIKILDNILCKTILNGDLTEYLSNLDILLKSGKPVVFRIPVIGGYTDDLENRHRIIDLLKQTKGNILKVELIKEHNLGHKKYTSLISGGNDVVYPNSIGVSNHAMMEYQKEMKEAIGIPVEICEI